MCQADPPLVDGQHALLYQRAEDRYHLSRPGRALSGSDHSLGRGTSTARERDAGACPGVCTPREVSQRNIRYQWLYLAPSSCLDIGRGADVPPPPQYLSLIHISEPTRLGMIS